MPKPMARPTEAVAQIVPAVVRPRDTAVVAQDGTGTEEADAADDLGGNPCGVAVCDMLRDESEDAGAQSH